jgi:hypothetical protein
VIGPRVVLAYLPKRVQRFGEIGVLVEETPQRTILLGLLR